MKKNFIYNIIYQILVLILPLITIPYVSRVLGAANIGIYSYTHSIAHYFILIAMLGINNYGNRTIAKYRNDKQELSKQFISIYTLQIISTIFMLICYLLYINMFNVEYKQIAVIQTIYIASAMFDINWLFFGLEKFKITITRNTLIKVLSLILIFVFVKEKSDLWIYTLILTGTTIFSNIFLLPFLKKNVNFTKITVKDVTRHLKPCMVLFLPVIAVSIYKIMDKIMLGIMSEVVEVGYYENAEKIIQVPNAIISALGTVALPRVANMVSNKKDEEVKNMIKKTMPFIMFLTFPMVFGLIAISKDFSTVFFGQEFAKSGELLTLLSITVLFLAWGNVIRTQYLIPKEMDKHYVISAFIGAVVNFVMNMIFIPLYASIGACIGTIFAEMSVAIYQTFVVRKELEIKKYIQDSVVFLIRAAIMFIVILLIGYAVNNDIILKLVLQIATGIIIYLVLNIKYIFKDLGFSKYLKKKII